MPSHVNVPSEHGELRAIKYEAAYVLNYGPENRSALEIPAYVSFRVGDARVALTVTDAQDLLEALPSVLAQHDYSEFVTVDPKAVA
ncbi:hypothetical protein [Nocardia sp. NPDC056000]|uniref:hypothetical protein n=1 Tax=Nocardia sp. NPDC056000 TaxID=3345674 RepID=UPI0035DDE7A3